TNVRLLLAQFLNNQVLFPVTLYTKNNHPIRDRNTNTGRLSRPVTHHIIPLFVRRSEDFAKIKLITLDTPTSKTGNKTVYMLRKAPVWSWIIHKITQVKIPPSPRA